MPITVADLQFFQSERMIDAADGGGQMAPTALVAGAANSIFDDLSDVDRAVGDVSLRKIYAAVTSETTDKFLDAGVVVFREPADPNVSVLATTTGDFYDERAAIQNYVETYRIKGARFPAFLYETQIAGSRTLTLFGRTETEPPGANTTLVVEQGVTSQFVRVLRILEDKVQTFTKVSGSALIPYTRRIITCEISEALRATYQGAPIDPSDELTPDAQLYTTLVADAARYYGIRPVVSAAQAGDLSITVDGIYQRIVPTSQIETPVLDFSAAAARALVVPSTDGAVQFTVADTFGPSFALNVGRPLVPGSLTITVTGGTLRDDGGNLVSGATTIGSVNYATGALTFAATSPTYSGAKVITFQPGAAFTAPTSSAGLPITEATRYRTYVTTLAPIPARGTLMVDYLSQGNWYRLQDTGNGILAGAAESYGAGTVNFTTGSVSVTLGALPDLNSSLLFFWASGVDTLSTPEETGVALALSAGVTGIDPGSLTLTQGTVELTDQGDGTLTGTGGSATVDYATGALTVTLDTLPDPDDEIVIAGDRWTPATWHTETFVAAPDPDGVISLTLAQTGLAEQGVYIEFERFYMGGYGVPQQYEPVKDRDDGAGGWVNADGAVNYSAGTLTLDTDGVIAAPQVSWVEVTVDGWVVIDGVPTKISVPANLPARLDPPAFLCPGRIRAGTTITMRYRTATTTDAFTTTVTVSSLTFAAKAHAAATLVSGALRFTLGGRTYDERNGTLYYGYNPVTGAGTAAGTVDLSTGVVTLTSWPSASASTLTILARAERFAYYPSSYAVFRTPAAPVANGSFSFRVTLDDGRDTLLEASADPTGAITGTVSSPVWSTVDAEGRIDYVTGTVTVYFGQWVVASGYTGQSWYDPEAVREDGKILYPRTVRLDTLLYNCVTFSNLPLDSSIIGLDPVRLPSDGRVPTFRDGQLVLTHHTDTVVEATLSPTQVIDCGRDRLYRVAITDSAGQRLPESFYAVDRVAGTVTMAADLELTGYSGNYTIAHTVADLAAVADADLSGRLTLTKALSHDYPQNTARVSAVLYLGTLQARYAHLFAQASWTNVWSDTRIGSAPLAQYNDATYPILVTNRGAYPDRILIKFTSSTEFQVIGENLGIIGVGTTSEDCAPVNLLTGQPYFTLDYRGWGSGWATGNCVRFNLIGANYPIDLIRAVQPSTATGTEDAVELLLVGNIDG